MEHLQAPKYWSSASVHINIKYQDGGKNMWFDMWLGLVVHAKWVGWRNFQKLSKLLSNNCNVCFFSKLPYSKCHILVLRQMQVQVLFITDQISIPVQIISQDQNSNKSLGSNRVSLVKAELKNKTTSQSNR